MSARSVLVVGDLDPGDPGHGAVLEAVARELPAHQVMIAAPGARPPRARPAAAGGGRRALARMVVRADALLVAGTPAVAGGPGVPGGTRSLARVIALSLAVGALGRPTAVLGVGCGPVEGRLASTLARRLVARADLLVLRDRGAARALASTGARPPFRVGADPAWTCLADAVAGPAEPGDVVTVVICDRPPGAMPSGPLAVALGAILEAGLGVRLLPWRGGRADADLARRVAERLGGRATILPAPPDLRGARAAIAGSRAALALPYHARVAAAAGGVPCVMADAAAAPPGLGHPLAWRSVPAGDDPLRLAAAIIRQASGPPPLAAVVGERIAAAREGFRLLRLLLRGGRSVEAGGSIDLELAPVPWGR